SRSTYAHSVEWWVRGSTQGDWVARRRVGKLIRRVKCDPPVRMDRGRPQATDRAIDLAEQGDDDRIEGVALTGCAGAGALRSIGSPQEPAIPGDLAMDFPHSPPPCNTAATPRPPP